MITFGSKAETLDRLQPILKKSILLPQVRFTVAEWGGNQESCLNSIENNLPKHGPKLIVRSSAIIEDTKDKSNAGVFNSIGDISSNDGEEIINAISKVIVSSGGALTLEIKVVF